MSLLSRRRPPADPATAAALAAARTAETRAEVDRARALAELKREQDAAERTAEIEAERAARAAKRERDAERRAERAERAARRVAALRRTTGRLRLLAPLLIVNGAAVYGQVAYAYATIAPAKWDTAARLALAVLFAAAVESIAVYVGWHAHDALLAKATATAARLRRASYLIAGVVASINYAHFAGKHMAPTAAAVAFGLLSLLSPWLWGLHTRRVQHVQLVDEGAVDCTGATFSVERARAFPFRTWAARRWSIDHNVTDPAAAWAGYNAERAARREAARRAERAGRRAVYPVGRVALAWAVVRGSLPPAALEVAAPLAALPAAVEVDGEPSDPWEYAEPIDDDQTASDTGSPNLGGPEPANSSANLAEERPPRKRTPAAKKAARKPANTTAAKVAKWAAKMPDATHAEIAAKAGVSVRSVERYRPAKEPATPPASEADSKPVNGTAVDLVTAP